jgi:hypothetical protein
MSKIICDVCGSSYSETELQCPICGTAKSEAAKLVVETAGEEQSANGGKFSKNNNRKTDTGANAKMFGKERNADNGQEGAPSNMAMIIIVAVLLVAIVAVCIFIAVRVFDKPDPTEPTTVPTTSSTAPTVLEIPCTGLELVGNADKALSFSALGQTAQLTVKALPENTTDDVVVTYESSNPNIVLVDQNGQVTPVAAGNATITISYGIYSITVDVTCDIPAPVTELTLKFSDVTLSPTNGLTLKLYDGELDPSDITWTSSDEAVAYVENGVVTAVGNGKATITATYGDLSATCKIIVSGMNHETGFALACTWGVKSDATLLVGETIEIYLINKETNEAVKDLQWTNSNDFPKCCTVEASEKGVKVTAVESTANVSGQYVFIQTEYEGEIYKFIIRVKAAEVQQ